MSDVNILIGGEAGQGLQTVGEMIAKALVRSGYEVHVSQDYLSRVRGGHNTFAVRFGPERLLAPRESVDVLVALDAETVTRHTARLTSRGVIVADESVDTDHPRIFKVPFKSLAPKPIFANTAALGVLASVVCEDLSVLEEMLAEAFGGKGEAVVAENVKVLRAAAAWKEAHEKIFECPAPSPGHAGRLCVNGNEALALGAMAAGVNFCAFYPMTPSTGVALNLIAHSRELGIVVEQAEDEIAALNMVLGASYAGARALVATSGGGFALMTEAVSLAGMTEIPAVIVVGMRPGPATGLPTRTEQGELWMVLHAGHGEFPRAIFAPGDPEDCFHLTHAAFDLAERWQSPVFVLTDQYLADSTRSVQPFDLAALPPVAGPLLDPDDPAGYKRYAITDSGVSPRAVPGLSPALVVVDSDEHDEEGHITEDHAVRVAMVDKRNRKFAGLAAATRPPVLTGPEDAGILLVSWGSTKGPALEARAQLAEQGRSVSVLHFSQVWPLDPGHFLPQFARAKAVVSVEGNSTGHFAGLIRRQTGFAIPHLVPRYDGLPFTADYILAGLARTGLI